jgi:hypothetical protein
MAATDIAATGLSDVNRRSQLRRAVIASTIGTTIEWYDFLLYSIVTGLVFAKLYFPAADPLIATMWPTRSFCRLYCAAGRAFIFGHYGDGSGAGSADRDPAVDGLAALPWPLSPATSRSASGAPSS